MEDDVNDVENSALKGKYYSRKTPSNSTPSDGKPSGGYQRCRRTRSFGAKQRGEAMIDKMMDKSTETVMKKSQLSMEESSKQKLRMMKRQRKSGDTELTYMSKQAMYLTQYEMDKDNPTGQIIIECMVKNKLGGGSGGRGGIDEPDEREC